MRRQIIQDVKATVFLLTLTVGLLGLAPHAFASGGGSGGLTIAPKAGGGSLSGGPDREVGEGEVGIANRSYAQRGRTARQMMQRLGLSADDLSGLRERARSGALGADDTQKLCARFAARQVDPSEVDSVARALGVNLTGAEKRKLRSCIQLGRQEAKGPSPQERPKVRAERTPSRVERTFRALGSGVPLAVPSAGELTQFGYSLFATKVSTFAPVNNVPVGDDYVIGPGDDLKVLMWGRINKTVNLDVGRDGSVQIPEIGPLQVAGLSFAQAKKLIEDRAGQTTGVNVDVTMGRLRTIQIFVVGEVDHPGAYTVSALSRVSNALAASGGITKIGSLRRIQLRRGNQLVQRIDLYDLLLNGSTEGDQRLKAGDVIFVPVIGPVVGIIGDVKRPAIYELSSSSETLDNLVKLAGGISAFGYSQRVKVERVVQHEKRVALDVDLDKPGSRRFRVGDGDLVRIFPVLPAEHDVVRVSGNVNRPGTYQWRKGMRVSDLISAAEGVAPGTFFKYALIRRREGRRQHRRMVPVDLGKAMAGNADAAANPLLSRNDELRVFNRSQLAHLPMVKVFGEVRKPGEYVLSEGMRVSDLVYMAGGLLDSAFRREAELARTEVIDGSRTAHTFRELDLRAALAGSDRQNPLLKSHDQLFIRRASGWHLPWIVEVKGRVVRPGPYTIRKGERLASVLRRSGGLEADAYLPATVLIRQSVKKLQQKRLDEARNRLRQAIAEARLISASQGGGQQGSAKENGVMMLEKLLAHNEGLQAQGRVVIHMKPLAQLVNSSDNIALVDKDVLTIPRKPAAVNVLGQVYSPNAIVYHPGLTTRDYLEMAGGANEGADVERIMVIRADGSVLTDEGIRSSLRANMFPLLPTISGGLMTKVLRPGDTVYVPQKLVYTDKLRVASTVAQIISTAATTLGVMGILAASL